MGRETVLHVGAGKAMRGWLEEQFAGEQPLVILTCSGCWSSPPAQLGGIILGGWPSWGAPAPHTPWTWRLRRQQGSPKWGGGGRRPPPRPCWRRRRQVRGVWGAGAPQEGQPPRIMLPSCAGGRVLPALPQLFAGPIFQS